MVYILMLKKKPSLLFYSSALVVIAALSLRRLLMRHGDPSLGHYKHFYHLIKSATMRICAYFYAKNTKLCLNSNKQINKNIPTFQSVRKTDLLLSAVLNCVLFFYCNIKSYVIYLRFCVLAQHGSCVHLNIIVFSIEAICLAYVG